MLEEWASGLENTMNVMEERIEMQRVSEGGEVERLQEALDNMTAQVSRLKVGVVQAIKCSICTESLRNAML